MIILLNKISIWRIIDTLQMNFKIVTKNPLKSLLLTVMSWLGDTIHDDLTGGASLVMTTLYNNKS